VGINTAILEDAQNIGFAISVDAAQPLIDEIRAGGGDVTPDQAFLGVETVAVSELPVELSEQFGVDVEEAPRLLKEMEARGLDLRGFHVFSGSQNLHAEILVEAQRRTVDLVLRMAGEMAAEPTYFNLGGGFGIPYYDKDRALDLDAVGRNLEELMLSRVSCSSSVATSSVRPASTSPG
jgi:hypothetical protein